MGWNGERNDTDDLLMRIVALLLALASLAERAVGLPQPVRSAALWFLRPAQALAWEFVTGQACPEIPCSHRRDERAEAMRLAVSFRALARSLEAELAAPPRFPSCWSRLARHVPPRQLRTLACEAPTPDTS